MDREIALMLYGKMKKCRLFEEKTMDLSKNGKIHGTLHLCVGEEATGVGICAALEAGDYFTQTHRGRSAAFGAGFDMTGMFAELLGKPSGICKGRGGSMHIADFSRGSLGANGIVGGGLPIACGAALSQKMRGKEKAGGNQNITVCFFGDGAMNEGAFHEAMNLAALWKLPVLFVCTNNLYGMSTHIRKSTAISDLASRGAGYGVPARTLDGNDASLLYEEARNVRRQLPAGGPELWVLNTYRWYGHSKSDHQVYRDQREVDGWKKRCPLETLRKRMCAEGWEEEAARQDAAAAAEVQEALEAALGAAEEVPEVEEMARDVYA